MHQCHAVSCRRTTHGHHAVCNTAIFSNNMLTSFVEFFSSYCLFCSFLFILSILISLFSLISQKTAQACKVPCKFPFAAVGRKEFEVTGLPAECVPPTFPSKYNVTKFMSFFHFIAFIFSSNTKNNSRHKI